MTEQSSNDKSVKKGLRKVRLKRIIPAKLKAKGLPSQETEWLNDKKDQKKENWTQ